MTTEIRQDIRARVREAARDGNVSSEERRSLEDRLREFGTPGKEVAEYIFEVTQQGETAARAILAGAASTAADRFSTARDQFLRATEIDPENSEGWSNLGGAYLVLGALAEAEGALRKALELEPASIPGHYNLGACLAAQGHSGAALDELERAVLLLADPGQKLGADRQAIATDLRQSPHFASIRGSQRFQALVRQLMGSPS